ncbi:NAD(P)-dependent oxidoreductase [Sphingomonas gei]|uniref:NAD(P)-dependent oxidoreductase n=1 Tax=Sphingomonas gei TaxID=1395960 RepID=A0A4S1WXZ2_9SPHN|nr:SDR family oxidoreductase [Sphingomonas gei]TGX48419.1 NAD(P)-dependent oxidoreductase [Sphingomonas gei]
MPINRTGERLGGKIALVTGAARGLGRACAIDFAKAGAHLVLVDVSRDIEGVPYSLGTASQLELTARCCEEAGALTLVRHADIRASVEIDATVAATVDRFGRLDIVLNSAGVAAPAGRPVHEVCDSDWELMIDVDLSGCFRMTRAAAAVMVSQRAGSIINIASTAGLLGYPRFAGYVAAKHGVIGLTRAAALDLAPYKVRVNALCPGSVRDADWTEGSMLTEIARSLGLPIDSYEQNFLPNQPLGALIEPEDVSGAAVWLASDESRQVTGSVITVDGGYSAR